VPQLVRYDCALPSETSKKFPEKPANFAENPHHLLKALASASEVCDPDSTRYALACLQLRGPQGIIAATDGRQLMQLSGFTFPWEGDLLVPRNKIFASPELADDHPILVGKEGDWVALQCGPSWTIWLAINKDGRFPDVTRHIPKPTAATAQCQLSPADADFLGQALSRLPCNESDNFPITVDLNGSIAIRAKAADQAQPTEVVLSNSTWSGEPIRINSNRKFLARALKLGFRELCVYSDQAPIACFDDSRIYVWALLDAESAIKPDDDAIRIESPLSDSSAPTVSLKLKPKPRTKRKPRPVSEPIITNSNGHAETNGHATKPNSRPRSKKSNPQDMASLIEQAMKLRTALHDLTHTASNLVKALKQRRSQSRALESTIAQLRTLKTLV